MSQSILLTGASGFLGHYLLKDLLLAGASVAVLIRPKGDASAADRLEHLLGIWQRRLGRPLPRPVCLSGDVTCEGLGLSEEDRGWLKRHGRAVVHCAASLTFVGSDPRREPWLTNYAGTEHLLEVCRSLGLRQWHHVSTAFVCGERSDTVREEDRSAPQRFRNDYEQTKFQAERLLRGAEGAEVTVYRPAVIVGDSGDGYTTAYNGLYLYLKFIETVTRDAELDATGRKCVPCRLNVTGNERRNLVPVDWVSRLIVRAVMDARHHGKTYHLTPAEPTTVREIVAAAEDFFNFYGVHFEGQDIPRKERNDVEHLFYETAAVYEAYWQNEPLFDATNTHRLAPDAPCPRVEHSALLRLCKFAVQNGWGAAHRRARRTAAH